MAVQGNWTLHYSWGFTGNYSQAPINFNSDGTFGGAYNGKWRQLAGTIMLIFNSGPANYGGTVNGNIGSGMMSTFSGLDGFWYLSEVGTTGILPTEALSEETAQVAGADGTHAAAANEPQLVGAGTKTAQPGRRSRR